MSTSFALAIKRLHGGGIVRAAARHNLREIAAELGADSHIDTKRIADNVILRGPATGDEVAELAGVLLQAAGISKLRKNCVQALELLFTLPAGTAVDLVQYFEEATAWAAHYFAVPVLSSVIHRDEGAPHAHVLLLPLLNGRMVGSDLHGGRAQLWAMQKDFHEAVGGRHGLARQAPQKRLSAPVRGAGMDLARATLMANSALTDSVIEALLVPHAKDPAPLLLALGITMPTPPASGRGSFADIMTKPVALESRNPIGNANRGPAAADADQVPERSQPYSCVGIASANDQILSHPAGMPTASAAPAQAQHPPISSTPATDTASPAPATTHQLARSTADQPADEVQNQHPTARRLLNFKDTLCVTTARATMDHPLTFEDISAANAPCEVGVMSSAAGQHQAASTVQKILHTPLVLSAKLGADQAASTSPSPHRRARVKQPVAAAAELAAVLALEQVDREHGPADDRAPAADDQAAEQPNLDAGPATVPAPTNPAAAERPAKSATTSLAAPVSATPKRPCKATISRTASAPSTSRPVPAAPGTPLVQVATTRTRAVRSTASATTAPSTRSKAAAGGKANPASRSKSKLTAANRKTSTATASGKANAQQQVGTTAVGAKGPHTAQPLGAPSRQNIRDGQQPTNHATSQRYAPEDLGTRSHTDDVQQLDAILAASTTSIRRASTSTPGQRAAAADSVEAGKSRIDIRTDQPDDIRRLGVGVVAEPNAPGRAAPASSFSRSSEIREIPGFTGTVPAMSCEPVGAGAAGVSQPDEIRTPDQPPAARQAPPSGGTRSAMPREPGHTLPPCHLLTLLGDQHQAISMLASEGDLEHLDADRYQRHLDDDHPAELRDEQRGEFASAPSVPTKTRCSRWPPDEELARGRREARSGTIDAALSSILALRGAG
ncbi:plasmid recombination protein [Duganella aquatilis]|nr:plasmid recombination protein [Duganella aquatilis]